MIVDKQETIIGINKDPQFGPMIMFGLGGIYVEILKMFHLESPQLQKVMQEK